MSESEDAGKYQVHNDKIVQGLVIGDNPTVHQHFYRFEDKATSSTKKPEQPWNIPYQRNDYFTGREEILEQLHARFKTGNATALSQRYAMSGLGGIGKTQIAVEYAHRSHQDYQAVLWARAESPEALTSSFVAIAFLLDLPQKDAQDQTLTVKAVKHWLQANSGWLLILDNADEPAIVREFLPTKFDGHILLTTRAQALGTLAQRIEVDTFTPELGALFLLRCATLIAADAPIEQATPQDREIAMRISEELGGLPLALDQAGAYIEETGCSLVKYLEYYQIQRTKLLKRRGGGSSDYLASVSTTWSLSFERVEQQNVIAADLLRLCAFLAPDAIPEEIIIKGASYLGEHLQSVLEDEDLLDEAIGALKVYSLIRRDVKEKTLSIHRLVQAVLRDAMDKQSQRQWAERAVLAVSEACPDVEFTTWPQWEHYLPHAQACADLIDLIEQEGLTLVQAAVLLSKAGLYLRERAGYTEAEPLYKRALAISEQELGPQHPLRPLTALSLNSLGVLYDIQGKYSEAEFLLKRALAISEQELGPQHFSTTLSLKSLANLYKSQGKYSEAESLYRHALVISEQELGPQHFSTALSLNNLAVLYYDQGKYSEAEPLYRCALAIFEQELGPQHPHTVTCLNSLAVLYHNQGKYSEAEPLLERALAIYKQELGPQHPDTAFSLNSLAELYRSQGKYSEAEPLYRHALAIREQRLGPQHPSTACSLNNLGILYDTQGKYSEAEPLLERALAIYKQELPQHPDAACSLYNLAVLYYNQGKYSEAEPLLKRALAICEQELGPQHPHMASSLNSLAMLYDAQGKYSEAEPL